MTLVGLNSGLTIANETAITKEGSRRLCNDSESHTTSLLDNRERNYRQSSVIVCSLLPRLISSLAAAFCAACLPPDRYRREYANASPAEQVAVLSKIPKTIDWSNVVFPDMIRCAGVSLLYKTLHSNLSPKTRIQQQNSLCAQGSFLQSCSVSKRTIALSILRPAIIWSLLILHRDTAMILLNGKRKPLWMPLCT